jgi:nicotinate-nucleotide adenylyltransferase
VDTVSALLAERPSATIALIVGSDALAELPSWKESARLRALCQVAVVTRPGDTREAPDADVLSVEGPSLPVSGTTIRRRVAEGRSIRYLVPDAVADYIAKRGLYQ